MRTSVSAALWLPALAALGPPRHAARAYAYQPGTGSSVAGNLSAAAPYGISPSEFAKVTKRLSASATFNITGYDVSVDAAAPAAVPGWTLTVGVTTDVSLINAANRSNLDFEATTLSVGPPGGNATLHPSWTICAVVFPGLAGSASNASATTNGSCGGLLSGDCIQAIQGGSAGVGSNGTCGDYALPSACTSQFPAASVNSTAIGRLLLPELPGFSPSSRHVLTAHDVKPSTRASSMTSASTHMAAPLPRRPTRPPTSWPSAMSGR